MNKKTKSHLRLICLHLNHIFYFFFQQRGFFYLPEGHHFIEPVLKSPGDPAGTPEPHIIYPRPTTETHRKKRSAEVKETPSHCGVQGVYVIL